MERITKQAREITNEYARNGYVLTLRQLYYQFVARGLVANTAANYHKVGKAVA